jgi:hypothetical protein
MTMIKSLKNTLSRRNLEKDLSTQLAIEKERNAKILKHNVELRAVIDKLRVPDEDEQFEKMVEDDEFGVFVDLKDVATIERVDLYCTVIGYRDPGTKKYKEWYLEISKKAHNELVKRAVEHFNRSGCHAASYLKKEEEELDGSE